MTLKPRRLFALALLIVPVGAGLVAMVLGHAPRAYTIGNAVALLLALGLALVPLRLDTEARRWPWIAGLLLVLAYAAVAGPPLDGFRRWIAIGPFRIHAGMLVGPSLAVLLALASPALRIAGMFAAIAIACVAPDLAMAVAWAGALLPSLHGLRPRLAVASIALAALMVAATALRHDPLQPVPHVEAVVAAVWRTSHIGGFALALAGLAPLLLALVRNPPARVLAGFWAGLSLAGLIGRWPSPLIGYGAAPILGYGLSLAAWRGVQPAPTNA